MRVVIADDSTLLREGIASFVRSEGIDVVARDLEPLRQHDLEGVAGEDVLLHGVDRGAEAVLAERRRRRRWQRRIDLRSRR